MGKRVWPDAHLQESTLPRETIQGIQSGHGLLSGRPVGNPRRLVKELAAPAGRLADLALVRAYSRQVFRLGCKPSFVTSLQGEWK